MCGGQCALVRGMARGQAGLLARAVLEILGLLARAVYTAVAGNPSVFSSELRATQFHRRILAILFQKSLITRCSVKLEPER